jgi:thiol-disulfide isomerase/thioredoxin
MRKCSLLLVAAALSFSCASEGATTSPEGDATTTSPAVDTTAVVKGKLLGHDGAPIQSHARLYEPGQRGAEFLAEIPVGDDGSFELSTQYNGYVQMEFTGVNHAQFRLGVLVEPGEHQLEVKLGTYARADEYEKLMVDGKRGKTGKPHKAELKQQKDGTWTAEIQLEPIAEKKPEAEKADKDDPDMDPDRKAWIQKMRAYQESLNAFADDEFVYQLSNATTEGRTINGTQADRLTYDGGGDYRSVVKTEGDKVTIVFDPKSMPPAGQKAAVTWTDPDSGFARIGKASIAAEGRSEEWMAFMREKLEGDVDGETREKAVAEISNRQRKALAEQIVKEQDELVRKSMLVGYCAYHTDLEEGDEAAKLLHERALKELDPLDPLWASSAYAMRFAIERSPDPAKYVEYADTAIAEHPSPSVGAALLVSRLVEAEENREMDIARKYFKQLNQKRFKNTSAARFSNGLDPDRPTAPGKTVPDFELASLKDPEVKITNESMLGQAYILDFWATWCGPCIGEMTDLHNVYADANGLKRPTKGKRYRKPKKNVKLQVLSVSFDEAPEDVVKFRKKEWPMPWTHAFADTAKRKQLHKEFSFSGIPNMLLIDKDGTIIATSGELRGAAMHETVKRYFTDAPKEPKPNKGEDNKDPAKEPVAQR